MNATHEDKRTGGRTGKPRFHKPKEFNPRSATPEQTAREVGTSKPTLLEWHRLEIIPSVVNEGRVIRFDVAEVKEALKARAKRKEGGAA